ncbi:hypothetical protein [Ralstonia thomasii]|uniref:hypothetical protein n=1 Tax=Ralstonia thomasii TaxID=3058596 RepID=UPI00292DB78A|nr:hypothetical protein [Ralstonia sp. LMG 18095]
MQARFSPEVAGRNFLLCRRLKMLDLVEGLSSIDRMKLRLEDLSAQFSCSPRIASL